MSTATKIELYEDEGRLFEVVRNDIRIDRRQLVAVEVARGLRTLNSEPITRDEVRANAIEIEVRLLELISNQRTLDADLLQNEHLLRFCEFCGALLTACTKQEGGWNRGNQSRTQTECVRRAHSVPIESFRSDLVRNSETP